jgi:uncharacterized protein YciI
MERGSFTMHYLLFYEGDQNWVTKRIEFRDAHLAAAWAASDRGEIILAGALKNPEEGVISGAVLLFAGDSPAIAEEFAKADPYVINGVVKDWYIREWVTVAGKEAATPVKPANEP